MKEEWKSDEEEEEEEENDESWISIEWGAPVEWMRGWSEEEGWRPVK